MIVKRGSGYGVSVYDPALRRKRWIGTFGSLREAREVERRESTRPGAAARETCESFARRWISDYPRAAPASRRTYGCAVKSFAEDFAAVVLSDLDRPRARAWALAQPQSNVRAVRAMLSDAINDGLPLDPIRSPISALNSPAGGATLLL